MAWLCMHYALIHIVYKYKVFRYGTNCAMAKHHHQFAVSPPKIAIKAEAPNASSSSNDASIPHYINIISHPGE